MWFDEPKEEMLDEDKAGVQPTAAGKKNTGQNHGLGQCVDPTRAFDEDDNLAEEASGVTASVDEISSLKQTIRDLDAKAAQNYDRYLRALAELENFKKRTARDRADLIRAAGEDILSEILPVIDNLERTLEHLNENADPSKILEGVALIKKQFLKALEKAGVTRIDQVPAPFNPEIHQALQRVEDKNVADDTVVEILQSGYLLNGKVVRPAMVKVVKHH
jgi:molecular chaperone GrpE